MSIELDKLLAQNPAIRYKRHADHYILNIDNACFCCEKDTFYKICKNKEADLIQFSNNKVSKLNREEQSTLSNKVYKIQKQIIEAVKADKGILDLRLVEQIKPIKPAEII